ncbi:MAG: 50S ribosomal protein L31 [Parcubacteria group bacterium]|nr:50S ribosomal protein L31 [Parcubacteria group bacterium]
MKENIHPTFYENVKVTCACGNTWVTASTLPEIKLEICAACHPFFTGKEKLIDTAGRVDRFKSIQAKSTSRGDAVAAIRAARTVRAKARKEKLPKGTIIEIKADTAPRLKTSPRTLTKRATKERPAKAVPSSVTHKQGESAPHQ